MIETFLTETVKIIAGVALPYIAYLLRQSAKKNNALQSGVKALLCNCIVRKCKAHTKEGYCSTEDWNELEELNKSYHELGGNGTVKELMRRVKKLPLAT